MCVRGCRVFEVAGVPRGPHAMDGIVVRELPGRGRGLCATRDIRSGEKLFVSTAFGFALYDATRGDSGRQQLCCGCLRFAPRLPLCCGACGSSYCSVACEASDRADNGHEHCCAALARLAAMSERKVTQYERSAAGFLMRVFARRRASSLHDGASRAWQCSTWLPEPTFTDALAQCADAAHLPGYSKREAARERAVSLAALHAGRLIRPRDEAATLLRVEPHNSYALRDTGNALRGWVMYPHASMMNHSCLPNAACVASGWQLTFHALADIACGEELTQCYLHIGEDGASEAGGTADWGFDCQCARCDRGVSTHRAARGRGEVEAAIAAFDAVHRCTCGCLVIPSMASHPTCRCHDHPPLEMAANAIQAGWRRVRPR
jgi:hypothetical protein